VVGSDDTDPPSGGELAVNKISVNVWLSILVLPNGLAVSLKDEISTGKLKSSHLYMDILEHS
jgi:hypothetical protein